MMRRRDSTSSLLDIGKRCAILVSQVGRLADAPKRKISDFPSHSNAGLIRFCRCDHPDEFFSTVFASDGRRVGDAFSVAGYTPFLGVVRTSVVPRPALMSKVDIHGIYMESPWSRDAISIISTRSGGVRFRRPATGGRRTGVGAMGYPTPVRCRRSCGGGRAHMPHKVANNYQKRTTGEAGEGIRRGGACRRWRAGKGRRE